MSKLGFEELSGLPQNPHCFHCVLPPLIERFQAEHPDKPSAHLVMEVAQVLGELIGSGLHNSGSAESLQTVIETVLGEITRTAEELLSQLPRRQQ